MSRTIRLTALLGFLLLALGVGLVLARNHQFEAGSHALKVEDYSTALRRLKPLASVGDSRAQYVLGEMYALGLGVPEDDSKAIYWFRRAAIGSNGEADPAAAAELAVAKNYAQGIGVRVDADQSLKWFHRAADGGSKEAAAELDKSHSR
jgi:TPR repeat protein